MSSTTRCAETRRRRRRRGGPRLPGPTRCSPSVRSSTRSPTTIASSAGRGREARRRAPRDPGGRRGRPRADRASTAPRTSSRLPSSRARPCGVVSARRPAARRRRLGASAWTSGEDVLADLRDELISLEQPSRSTGSTSPRRRRSSRSMAGLPARGVARSSGGADKHHGHRRGRHVHRFRRPRPRVRPARLLEGALDPVRPVPRRARRAGRARPARGRHRAVDPRHDRRDEHDYPAQRSRPG